MNKDYITIPNIVTFSRLVGSIILIFIKPLTKAFYIIYTISGLTDGFDGFLARRLGGETVFGSKLDSVSDLSFYTIMMIKILPFLYESLPTSIWRYVALIVGFRIATYIIGAIKKKKFLSSHTYLNKASGFMVFILPFFIGTHYLEPYSWMLIAVTALASLYEMTYSIIKTND